MDGNGRWAEQRQMPRFAGHRAGVETVRAIVKESARLGIEALTLFAFSTENWRRPRPEVNFLMDLFMSALDQELDELHRRNVRFRVIGDLDGFSRKLRSAIERGVTLTAGNDGLTLVIAVNYGGRWDITQAMRKLGTRIRDGQLAPEEVTLDHIHAELCLNDLPEPDLFIRTGGEHRISNYLLWQLAYTELYFCDCLWPDFDIIQFQRALESYGRRQRRFGMTGLQVEANQGSGALQEMQSGL
ncbi:MAG: di-trans,poly-cis-decaprenylcistransferase [Gammaproteobacteria bacterium]|nr:di-trans,poly-cis-decaprenylcistransferase [Gammaproteobacteria bacterium]